MFYETILPFIIVIGSFVISLIISIPLWKSCKWPWDESEDSSDDRYERFTFERQVEKAKQTYEELKAIMGKEEIDEVFDGYSFNNMVEALNHIGNMASLAGCSMSELADAFNAIATPSAETTETQEQKEPQVIFEPKVMIIEPQDKEPIIYDNIISIKQDDKEVNPFDDWYDNFMKEIEQ